MALMSLYIFCFSINRCNITFFYGLSFLPSFLSEEGSFHTKYFIRFELNPVIFLKSWFICQNVYNKIFKLNYRHSSIYAVNVGKHTKTEECKNRGYWDYLVVLKGRKIGYDRIINRVNSKIAEIETAEIKECMKYFRSDCYRGKFFAYDFCVL
jgi:hypothetical protein